MYNAVGSPLGVTGDSLEFHPPSWPYHCNERVRNSNATVGGHWYALGGVPSVVAQCIARSMALHQEGMESERKVQHYWETVEESLPIGSEEAEHANRLSWYSYWRRVEVCEALKKKARKWNH